eukprot:306151-Hanusia_phi.AAC.5
MTKAQNHVYMAVKMVIIVKTLLVHRCQSVASCGKVASTWNNCLLSEQSYEFLPDGQYRHDGCRVLRGQE